MIWQHIDLQMSQWESQLKSEVKLSSKDTSILATTIAADIRFLSLEDKNEIIKATPILIENRLDELKAFQKFMEETIYIRSNPALTRAQVIVQNYICFVYLPESCFKVLAKVAPSGSVTRKCAKFLTKNPIRAFRNAIAHANWSYRDDFLAIIYWARKGNNLDEQLEQFEVDQVRLAFWQGLSRCVAYVTYSNL